ncbi:TetR/AcrR family transcriptional regulator [Microbacterium sp. W1N]|uniref:TetR/AcrR family transcriptional regulator n=1 Tax=Microbacterium festucae TaxID=2977531 RepID=UPI0021C112FD|nr:TetR/AcrR family transcriptional regulator [Microbacterium festucae]MCT9820324.1 TetR/AcrR family transcriptional regulator [Microbacterium festucae]
MTARAGRPRATSRESIAEAACELFLEQGYEHVAITDIASRAGVSRSSFFNYFSSKADILWAGLDLRLAALDDRLGAVTAADGADADTAVRREILRLADGFAPDSLALAVVNADQMGLADELAREAAQRTAHIAGAASGALVRCGRDRLAADITGAAWGGAVLAAIDAWAREGAGRAPLAQHLVRAAEIVSGLTAGPGPTRGD